MDEQEKTEEPTSKKLEDARKEGNVAKSQDVVGLVTLVVGIVVLIFYMKFVVYKIEEFYIYYFTFFSHEWSLNDIYKILQSYILQISYKKLKPQYQLPI